MEVSLSQLFLYSWILLGHFTQSTEIHKMMTNGEYEDIFGGSRDNVPDYEVVEIFYSINIGVTRNITLVSFHAFGEDVVLDLQPVAHTPIPVWFSYGFEDDDNSTDNGSDEVVDPSIIHDVLNFYEDSNNKAAIFIEMDDQGIFYFVGTAQGRFIIRPIFSSALKQTYQHEIDPVIPRNSATPNYHIVIGHLPPRPFVNTAKRSTVNKELIRIFPRLLIFTHYEEHFEANFMKSLQKILIYLVLFWHSVNFRFQGLPDLSIIFRIAGVVVGMNNDAAPYLIENWHENGIGIDVVEAVDEFSRWIKNTTLIPKEIWDIAVVLTDFNLCDGACDFDNIHGAAWVDAECNSTYLYTDTAAVIRDNRAFDGIHTATHELGHIFGAYHDGGDDTSSCADDEKIMNSHRLESLDYFEWSNCSAEAIYRHVKKTYSTCWNNTVYNYPDISDNEIHGIVPGRVMSRTDQCRERGWHWSCHVGENVCQSLRCRSWTFREQLNHTIFTGCHNTGAPLEGTECGKKKKCVAGKCVN